MSTISSMPAIALAAMVFQIASPARGQGVFSTGPGLPVISGSGSAAANAAQIAPLLDAAVDSAGDVYQAVKNSIRKTTAKGGVTTLAGSEDNSGSADGTGSSARFNGPQGVAVDASGNVYVADAGNHTIRKITYAGAVTTFAGSPGLAGNADGTGPDARFSSPQGVGVDARGNVYVADSKNHSIRKITSFGVVTTLAGAGVPGCVDGTGRDARFSYPTRVALDPYGNLYVTDTGNHVIRKISETGVASILAGAPIRQGRGGAVGGYADGTGEGARFNSPEGIAIDATGDFFVADSGNQRIRRVTRGGGVTTLDGTFGPCADDPGAERRFGGRFERGGGGCFRGRFERPSGTYIAGGLPSPGDIDVRFGRQFPPQEFGSTHPQRVIVFREPREHREHRTSREDRARH